jgi:hypothetical protein
MSWKTDEDIVKEYAAVMLVRKQLLRGVIRMSSRDADDFDQVMLDLEEEMHRRGLAREMAEIDAGAAAAETTRRRRLHDDLECVLGNEDGSLEGFQI